MINKDFRGYRVEQTTSKGKTKVLGTFYCSVERIRKAMEGQIVGGGILRVYHRYGKVVLTEFPA